VHEREDEADLLPVAPRKIPDGPLEIELEGVRERSPSPSVGIRRNPRSSGDVASGQAGVQREVART
jgi:hypothetical protein